MNDAAENAHGIQHSEFQDLGLEPGVIAALQRLKIDAPTEIQKRVIPLIFEGKDVLARATTGAGKTNAYLLPIIQRTTPGQGLRALILQPTRALALQLEKNLRRVAGEPAPRTAVAAGGRRDHARYDPLARRPDVLIATPRAAAALVRRGQQDWSTVGLFVIDEADAILDEHGSEPLRRIHAAFDHDHQTVVFASELNDDVRALADDVLRAPVETAADPATPRAFAAEQGYFVVEPEARFDVLVTFCKQSKPKLAIVFANTEQHARDLTRRLDRARISSRWIGERRPRRRPAPRERPARRARSEVIVAHDPAPRRLSTIPASHLLHYELPDDVDVCIRRLEQAARLRKDGVVIAFVQPDEHEYVEKLEQRLGKPLQHLETPRRPSHRRGESTPQASPSSEGPPPEPNSKNAGRLSQPLRRDDELEARGVHPPPRTLGSRFRTSRRSKPLRRPGSPN